MDNEKDYEFIFMMSLSFIFLTLFFGMALLFSSCTISINAVHTQGEASDVVDETQKTDADISPNLSFPLTS